MHPEIELLIAFGDGSLEPASLAEVSAHLETCAVCRDELERRRRAPAPEADERLAGLREHIRQWEDARCQTAEQLRRKVLTELVPFLGDAAVNKLLGTVGEDGGNLLSTFEPVLARFLGISAAAELVSHLVDTAIY
jgi:putative zinc finger protein